MAKSIPKIQKLAVTIALVAVLLLYIVQVICLCFGVFTTQFTLLIFLLFVAVIFIAFLYPLNYTLYIGWKHIVYLVLIFAVVLSYFFIILPFTAKLNQKLFVIAVVVYGLLQLVCGYIFYRLMKNTPER